MKKSIRIAVTAALAFGTLSIGGGANVRGRSR